MQHTVNGSEEYYISLRGTRLQTRRYGKGLDMGNIIRRRRLCWAGHVVRMEGER